jgi:hypothetical protein
MASLTSINSPSGRGTEAQAALLQNSQVIRAIEANSAWKYATFESLSVYPNVTSAAPGRALNSNFTRSNDIPPSPLALVQGINGDAVQADVALRADHANDAAAAAAHGERVSERFISFAESLDTVLMTNPSAPGIKGLRPVLSSSLPGFGSTTALISATAATTGTPVSLDITEPAKFKQFAAFLQKQRRIVRDANTIFMNASLLAYLVVEGKALGLVGSAIDPITGQMVDTIVGLPVYALSDSAAPLDEPDKTPTTPLTNTTSLYILSLGENRVSMKTNCSLYYNETNHTAQTEKYEDVWEVRGAWDVRHPDYALRINHIKI